MKFGIQDRSEWGPDPLKRFTTIRDMGFDVVEVHGRDVLENPGELKRASAVADIAISSICGGYRGWIGDFDESRRQQALHDISRILQRGSQIGAKGIVIPAAYGMFSSRLSSAAPLRDAAGDQEVLLDSLHALESVAVQTDTFLYLEPLNRYEDHMINHVRDAGRLIQTGGFTRVKIAYDTFHMNIEEVNPYRTLLEASPVIGHIHLGDSNRLEPGAGHLAFEPIFQALHETAFSGCLILECRPSGDTRSSFARSLKFLQSVFSQITEPHHHWSGRNVECHAPSQ